MTDATELTTMPTKADIPAMFKKGTLEDLVKRIEKEARSFVFDVTSSKGRKEARSMASKVSRSKTLIDEVGKAENEERNALNKKVNVERNMVKERLDELRDEIRKPVEDWETAEADRVKKHQVNIGRFDDDKLTAMNTSAELLAHIGLIDGVEINSTWDEFEDEALDAKKDALAKYQADHDVAKQREDQAAELEKLRADAEDRRIEDEKRATKERMDREHAEAEKREAEQAKQREAEFKDREEQNRKDEADRARIAAEETQARHEREIEEAKVRTDRAAQDERDRLASEQRSNDEAAEKRRQDQDAREKIIASICASLKTVEPRTIKAMVEAMYDGKIPNVTIKV